MELTSGQQALQNEVRTFVDQEIIPFASEYDSKAIVSSRTNPQIITKRISRYSTSSGIWR